MEMPLIVKSFELIATNPTDAQRLREALGPLLSRAKISVKDRKDITEEVLPVVHAFGLEDEPEVGL